MRNARRVISWILVMAMLITNVDYVHAASAPTVSPIEAIEDVSGDVSAEIVTDGDGDVIDVPENELPEDASGSDVSEGDVSEDVSGDDMPEGDVSETDVSGADVSGNDVSDSDVSGNDVSHGDVPENDVPNKVMAVQSGTECGLEWEITSNGVLTISGTQEPGSHVWRMEWREYADTTKKVIVTAKNVTSTMSWFDDFENVTSFDFSKFDTSSVTNMDYMFYNCRSLKSLNVSKFDTSNVTSMQDMFAYCISLTKLDVSNFDTSKVTNMENMFESCTSLRKLDVSNFDTSNVTDMYEMFAGLGGLTKLDLSNFDTSKVTDMSYMFLGSKNLTSINLSSFDTSNVTNMEGMFSYCSKIRRLDLSSFDTSKVTNMSSMFNCCYVLTNVNVSSFDTSKVTYISGMFSSCRALKTIDLSNFDLSALTQTYTVDLFPDCSSLTRVRAFKNLTKDILLPANPMFDINKKEYRGCFPKNLSSSIWLYYLGDFCDPFDASITVCDSKSYKPISGASVTINNTNYTTGADGTIHFVSNKKTHPNVSISHKRYHSLITTITFYQGSYYIYLEPNVSFDIPQPNVSADIELENSFEFEGSTLNWLDIEYSLDLSDTVVDKLPFSFEYDEENQTYKVIFGVDYDETDLEPNQAMYETIRSLCENAGNTKAGSGLKDFMKKNCKPNKGSAGIETEFAMMGYFEYNIQDGSLKESGAVVTISGEGSLSWYPPFFLPVYIKGTLGLSAEGKLVITFADEKVDFTATLRFEESLGIGAGIGGDFAHVEVGATATLSEELDIPYFNAQNDLRVGLNGKVYAEAVLWILKAEKEVDLFDVTLWPWPEKSASSSSLGATSFDTSTMTLAERDYQMLSGTPVAKEYMLRDVYSNANAQMVMLKDGTMLAVWLADTGEKSSANRTTLVYSVNSGLGWTSAKAVCETGRGDFYPHLTVDGDKAALTYMNIDTVLGDDATVQDFAEHADLYTAVFENGEFSQPELLTESGNKVAEMNSEIAMDGDKLAVVWLENSVNDPYLVKGVNTLYLSTYDNGKWTKEKVADNVTMINSVAVAFVDGAPNVAYTLDADNVMNTTTDVELYLWASNKVTRVTTDQKVDTDVQFVGDDLYWGSNGEVMQMQAGNMASIVSTGITDTQDMMVLENETNRAILFVGADGFSSELYMAEEVDGAFGMPVPVTDKGNQITDYAAVYNENGEMTAMLFEREVVYDETSALGENSALAQSEQMTGSAIFGATNMHVCQDLAAHNVILRDAWYSMWDVTDDNQLPINLELYNASSEPLTSVTVSLEADGQAFYTETVTCDIAANDVADITIHYPMDATQMGRDITVKAVPGNFTDSNLGDNNYEMTLGYADIVLKDFAVEKVDGASVITGTVVNEGYQAAEDVSFKVLEGGQNGEEIYTVSCGDLAVGAEYDVAYTIPAEKLDFESAFEVKYFYVVTETEDGEEAYGNNSEVMPVFPVRVTGLTLDTQELTMTAGTTHQLTATVAPADAINKNVYFASSSHEVAVVLQDGTIIACAEGTATITVMTGDGGYTQTCTVTVTAPAEGAPVYTMNTRWASIEEGSTLQLSVLDAEENVVPGIKWSSTDESVATIDENGLVTANKVGATYILCSNAEGTYQNAAVIHVTSTELQALVFEESTVEMTEGDTYDQQPIYYPEDTTTDMALTWTSSDEAVATVNSEGVVTAVAAGRTTITATAVNGVSASYEVKVTALPRYTVTFDSGLGDEPVEITGVLGGSTVTLPAEPTRENYTFGGWFTEENGQGEQFTTETIVEEDMYLYAYWTYKGQSPEDETPEGLWATEVAPQTYTGKAIKPVVQVYDGHTLLTEKTDYTISYKNNTKANDASNAKKAPTITIKGKGNYTGKETITFQILAKDLAEEDITVKEMVAVAGTKVQKPVPTLTYNGKKLKNKTDFTVSYPDLENPDIKDAYKTPGTYTVRVEGKGNFQGTRDITFTITGGTLMSKVKIASIPKQAYTGSAIEPEVKVTYKGKTLLKDTDYTVTYKNNTEVGKATVIVTGMGDYAGTKEATFQITGISIAKAKVNGIVNKVYNGMEQTQELEVVLGGEKLAPSNYTVTYSKNVNVGKATVVITGTGNYTGTIKKTFKITAYDIKADTDKLIGGIVENLTATYTKGGSTPALDLSFAGTELVAKKDYTLSYSNNKKLASATDKKAPTIKIKGKGNFKGTIIVPFNIVAKDLQDAENPVTINVPDMAYAAKAGKYVSKPILTDSNGKKLVAGTDYVKAVTYTLADGTELNKKKDAPEVGTVIKVTVKGKGNYTGTLETTYKITQASFKSAKIKIDAQEYTGSAITLDPEDITVKMGKTELKYGEDYVIVEDSYKNNVKKGTASVTIKGVGNYGGEKTVKFKIASKQFVWFWNLF